MTHVAIVGAGCAGLACAIAAARAGAEVDVFDSRSGLRELPVHLHVAPSLLRDLAALGLAEACARRGFPYRRFVMTDGAGRRHTEMPWSRLTAPQLPVALGMTRQAFGEVLLEAALARGVRIHWNAPLVGIDFEGGAVSVLHLEGRTPVAPDLALLTSPADRAGPAMPFPREAQLAGEVTWWCGLMRRPVDLEAPTLVVAAPGRKALLLPVAGDTAGLALIDSRLDELAHGAALTAEQVQAWLRAHSGRMAQVAELLADDAEMLPNRVRAGLRPLPWHRGSVLCVGPAAHAFPHHFGQGAAQAVEDAVVVGELLLERAALDTASLLQTFVARRRPRLQTVFDIASRAAQWDRAPDGRESLQDLAAELDAAVAVPA